MYFLFNKIVLIFELFYDFILEINIFKNSNGKRIEGKFCFILKLIYRWIFDVFELGCGKVIYIM